VVIFVAMSEVTRILSQIEHGDPQAAEKHGGRPAHMA